MKESGEELPGTLYVRGLNWIGDAVLSLGALQGLKKVRPGIRIVAGAPEATADIYRLSGAIDAVIMPPPSVLDRSSLPGVTGKYDAAVVFPRSFRSALETFFLSRRRIGFASEGRSVLLTRALPYREWHSGHFHQSTYYESLLREIDPATLFEAPRLHPPALEVEQARNRLGPEMRDRGSLIAVNPGAYFGRAKTWPVHHFAALLGKLLGQDSGARILLFSGKADQPLAQALEKQVRSPRLRSFAGLLSLRESTALLSLCDFLITNDSGMMHLGGALGLRGVALFGPTDPVATGPVVPEEGGGIAIMRHTVSCQPCLLRECPIDHRCMEGLSPEEVYARIAGDLCPGPGEPGNG